MSWRLTIAAWLGANEITQERDRMCGRGGSPCCHSACET